MAADKGRMAKGPWHMLPGGHVGRLKDDLLQRIEAFSDRIIDVAESLAEQGRPRRVVDQLVGCGASVHANAFEAGGALGRPDFRRRLGISLKELGEIRCRLSLIGRKARLAPRRLPLLESGAAELKRISGAMVSPPRARGSGVVRS